METLKQKQQIAEKIRKLEQEQVELQQEIKLLVETRQLSKQKAQQQLNEIALKHQKLRTELKVQVRKDETRRKILLGAFVLHQLQSNSSFKFDHQAFREFLNHEHKTQIHRQKDLNLFKDLFE